MSEMERRYLDRLVEKHGMDVEGMARDVGLNYEQRTVGELRRGVLNLDLGKGIDLRI
jgi:nucleolar protein 16